MVGALKKHDVPVGHFLFDGEQHGFRRAENIKCALDAEGTSFSLGRCCRPLPNPARYIRSAGSSFERSKGHPSLSCHLRQGMTVALQRSINRGCKFGRWPQAMDRPADLRYSRRGDNVQEPARKRHRQDHESGSRR
jgi:hypothetical protein